MKALVLLLSLFFLFGGGVCSLAMIAQGGGAVIGIPMIALCIVTLVMVIKWIKADENKEAQSRKTAITFMSITALVVIAAYAITFFMLNNIGTR